MLHDLTPSAFLASCTLHDLTPSAQQVVVIVHQTPRPNRPIKALRDPAQVFEKRLPVAIVQENVLASISPSHHMVESAFKFDSKRTGHSEIISAELGIMHVTRPDPQRFFVQGTVKLMGRTGSGHFVRCRFHRYSKRAGRLFVTHPAVAARFLPQSLSATIRA